MSRRVTYFFSLAMLCVFALYTLPHEFVHIFYDHKDTEHCAHSSDHGPELSAVHIHCDFLSFYQTEFIVPAEKVNFVSVSVSFFVYAPALLEQVIRESEIHESRGPPTV